MTVTVGTCNICAQAFEQWLYHDLGIHYYDKKKTRWGWEFAIHLASDPQRNPSALFAMCWAQLKDIFTFQYHQARMRGGEVDEWPQLDLGRVGMG
ncbi:hypothetical protein VTJ49DRAFT_3326 [Mycothermus thermophilus]|uniref:Uncharacterized protein n=1 Tax=Humicola insolens TaxID=85995 RepID=A0ABR3V7U0_HUMIN